MSRHSRLARRAHRLVEDLTGRSGRRLLSLLGDQLTHTADGAELVERLASGEVTPAAAHERIRDIEHRGDDARATLIEELSQVLATPVDPEDLFRVSRCIDDVLDNLRDFVREVDLYQPDELAFAVEPIRTLREGLTGFSTGLGSLDGARRGDPEATLPARRAANGLRRQYQEGLAELFRRPVDPEALKRRELLRRLDVIGLRLGEAAAAFADALLKRNH
ncbi:DUF47 family protein [Actinocatenispora sera]|uniref:DUF47 domain-containing protein n=1 Tax=Actinocatenispora sera TaxID=390989 RepID=UPI0033DE6A64